VLLAAKPSHFAAMREAEAWHRRELGFTDGYLVAPDALHSEIGSRAYFGGLAENTTASLHPARYVFGLAKAAARQGAQLIEDAPVTSLLREEGHWRVVTRRGSLVAEEVLVATNGYTTDLVPAARNGIFPAGSYVIVTEPLPPALQAELSPRGRMFFDSRHFLNYFRLTPDGRMLFGGRHNLSTSLDMDESARLLRARMVEVFPQLRDMPVSHTWTGKLGLTFDLMPHIGRAPVTQGSAHNGKIWYAYGYAGHGVAIAGKLGREVGEMIAGVRPHSLFSQIPHQRTWWTSYDRYYLPLVSAWFRTLDYLS
jgi:glycine/D-amino acid oxidase-like deaminating enzyme